MVVGTARPARIAKRACVLSLAPGAAGLSRLSEHVSTWVLSLLTTGV
jgi:hypothetical protein